ncbi:MAG: hypothetical protein LBB43_06795 [Spirochaetaceae bacterium]|nr:hypothetical protein [Spirochaetaceae bacterium]
MSYFLPFVDKTYFPTFRRWYRGRQTKLFLSFGIVSKVAYDSSSGRDWKETSQQLLAILMFTGGGGGGG